MEKRTEASRSLIKRLEKEIQQNVVKPVQAATDSVKKAANRMVSKVPFVKNTGIIKPIKATRASTGIRAVKTTKRISKK
jgi:ribosomal protein S20